MVRSQPTTIRMRVSGYVAHSNQAMPRFFSGIGIFTAVMLASAASMAGAESDWQEEVAKTTNGERRSVLLMGSRAQPDVRKTGETVTKHLAAAPPREEAQVVPGWLTESTPMRLNATDARKKPQRKGSRRRSAR